MWRRIILDLIILACLFLLPWWVSLLLAIAASFYFKYFLELIFVGGVLDVLYGSSVSSFGFAYLFLLISIVLLFSIGILKQRLILY